MVCEKCEKKGKLGKVITPDPWKAGASNTTKPGGRKVGENKLLTASKNRFNPLTTEFKKCRICKVSPTHWDISLLPKTRFFYSKKFIRWVPITASSAPTRKVSVPCVGSRS